MGLYGRGKQALNRSVTVSYSCGRIAVVIVMGAQLWAVWRTAIRVESTVGRELHLPV